MKEEKYLKFIIDLIDFVDKHYSDLETIILNKIDVESYTEISVICNLLPKVLKGEEIALNMYILKKMKEILEKKIGGGEGVERSNKS